MDNCSKGARKRVKKMLDRDPSLIRQQDRQGKNGLILSIVYKSFKVTKILITDYAADIEQTDGKGWSALHYLVQSSDKVEYVDVLKLLLGHRSLVLGADSPIMSSLFEVVFSQGSELGCMTLFTNCEYLNADFRDGEENTLLHRAVMRDWGKVCRLLLEDFDVNFLARNSGGKTAKSLASEQKAVQCMKVFLDPEIMERYKRRQKPLITILSASIPGDEEADTLMESGDGAVIASALSTAVQDWTGYSSEEEAMERMKQVLYDVLDRGITVVKASLLLLESIHSSRDYKSHLDVFLFYPILMNLLSDCPCSLGDNDVVDIDELPDYSDTFISFRRTIITGFGICLRRLCILRLFIAQEQSIISIICSYEFCLKLACILESYIRGISTSPATRASPSWVPCQPQKTWIYETKISFSSVGWHSGAKFKASFSFGQIILWPDKLEIESSAEMITMYMKDIRGLTTRLNDEKEQVLSILSVGETTVIHLKPPTDLSIKKIRLLMVYISGVFPRPMLKYASRLAAMRELYIGDVSGTVHIEIAYEGKEVQWEYDQVRNRLSCIDKLERIAASPVEFEWDGAVLKSLSVEHTSLGAYLWNGLSLKLFGSVPPFVDGLILEGVIPDKILYWDSHYQAFYESHNLIYVVYNQEKGLFEGKGDGTVRCDTNLPPPLIAASYHTTCMLLDNALAT